VINTSGTDTAPPTSRARLEAIRFLLLDQTLALDDRIAGCLVALYGQQASRIVTLRSTEVSCTGGATRITFGAGWLDVPEPPGVNSSVKHHPQSSPTR